MNSFAWMPGHNTSENKTAFLGTSPDGIAIVANGKEYFLRYTDFPWFEYCNAIELRNVTADRWGVYWEDLDIDLSIESLEHPELFPEKIPVEAWLRARNRKAAQTLGSIRSARKALASRRNGAKGGRPRKTAQPVLA